MASLLLTIHFHDGRYHGVPDWPPSPARLFQALMAGAARGELSGSEHLALRWLEGLDPPRIRAPCARHGQGHVSFVPNNDLDAKGGDPDEVSSIRVGKNIRPWLFDAATPLLYHWRFDPSHAASGNASTISDIAASLYQLGRGIDMAWAIADILEDGEADARMDDHPGTLHTPAGAGRGGTAMACAGPGTLDSLIQRHKASSKRFSAIIEAAPTKADPQRTRVRGAAFTQPPKARFRQVTYDCPPAHLLYDLAGSAAPWRLDRAVDLVVAVRDAAASKLAEAFSQQGASRLAEIERVLIGRDASEADKALRVRIIPLPSIGSQHVTRAIRRVLIEVPPNCPVAAETIDWAFSALGVKQAEPNPKTGEIADLWRLSPAAERNMLHHYGIDPPRLSKRWQSVTPLALPSAARRRIAPSRADQTSEQKGGQERASEEARAAEAILQSLRHAGVTAKVATVFVQREPFAARGARAEASATPPRFPKEHLWHAELEFDRPIAGPLVLGNGRYLGLGLLHPVASVTRDILQLSVIEGRTHDLDPEHLCRAFRRALLSRLAAAFGEASARRPLVSGHEQDGAALRRGGHQHIAIVFDPGLRAFLIIHPDRLKRKPGWRQQRDSLWQVESATSGEWTLRIDRTQSLRLSARPFQASEGLVTRAQVWSSVTPYLLTRHGRFGDIHSAAAADIADECRRNLFPLPDVLVLKCQSRPGRGVFVSARLTFPSSVTGPLILGRSRHMGGGLFAAEQYSNVGDAVTGVA